MKIFVFISIALCLVACNQELKRADTLMLKNSSSMTEEMESALNEAIRDYLEDVVRSKASDVDKPYYTSFTTPGEFDVLEFVPLPLYTFDYKIFLEDPGVEQLDIASLVPDNEMLFIGKERGSYVVLLHIKKNLDGEWVMYPRSPHMREYFERDYSGLANLLEEIDDNKFYFWDCGGLLLVYEKNGERYYASDPNDKSPKKQEEFAEWASMVSKAYIDSERIQKELKEQHGGVIIK